MSKNRLPRVPLCSPFTTDNRPHLLKSLRNDPCHCVRTGLLIVTSVQWRLLMHLTTTQGHFFWTEEMEQGQDLLSCCLILYVTQNSGLYSVWEAEIADSEFSRWRQKLRRATFITWTEETTVCRGGVGLRPDSEGRGQDLRDVSRSSRNKGSSRVETSTFVSWHSSCRTVHVIKGSRICRKWSSSECPTFQKIMCNFQLRYSLGHMNLIWLIFFVYAQSIEMAI